MFFFSKSCITHQPEKILFKIIFWLFFSSVSISVHGFNPDSWLNLMTLCTFSILIYDFILALNFLCVKHIFLYHKSFLFFFYRKNFSTYPLFIVSGKKDKSLWRSCNFSGYWTSTSRRYPSSLFSLRFSINIFLNWYVFSVHWKVPTGNFCNIANPHKLFTFQYLIHDSYLFLSWSFMYFLLAFAYWWIAWHEPISDSFFYH